MIWVIWRIDDNPLSLALNKILLKISERTKDGIIAIDKDGLVLLWNHGAEQIFGYHHTEILHTDIAVIMPERYHDQHRKAIASIVKTGHHRLQGRTVEIYGKRKHGQEFPIEATLSSWEEDGVFFFTAVVRDISGRIAIEERNERILQSQIAISTLLKISIKTLSLADMLQEALNTILNVPWLSIESASHLSRDR